MTTQLQTKQPLPLPAIRPAHRHPRLPSLLLLRPPNWLLDPTHPSRKMDLPPKVRFFPLLQPLWAFNRLHPLQRASLFLNRVSVETNAQCLDHLCTTLADMLTTSQNKSVVQSESIISIASISHRIPVSQPGWLSSAILHLHCFNHASHNLQALLGRQHGETSLLVCAQHHEGAYNLCKLRHVNAFHQLHLAICFLSRLHLYII
jgi:hypothetical protein